jgi:2'-5' RNA ligase
MKNFWDTRGWPRGERRWHWHVLFDGQAAAQQLIEAYRTVTHHPALDSVPLRWTHFTLWSAHALDEINIIERQRIVAEVSRRCRELPPVELTIGPAEVGDGGVWLKVAPNPALTTLVTTLTEATATVVGQKRLSPAPKILWPHISLAYSNTEADDEPVQAHIDRLAIPPAQVTVRRIHLVNQHQHKPRFDWTVTFPITLGGA